MTSISINLDYPPSDTDKALLSALLGGTAGPGSPLVPVNNFPADPGSAPFPSQENSTSMILDGKISGAPYLRSAQGAVWRFDLGAAGSPIKLTSAYSTGYQVSVNGAPIAGAPIQQMMVRQGEVYFQADTIWSALEQTDAPISGLAHTTPPPPWTGAGTSADGHIVALPDMPASPPAFTAWTGNVILFGDGQAHKDMQSAHDAASPGDAIQAGPEMVGKTIAQTLGTTKPITLDLLGRITAGAGTASPIYQMGVILDLSALDASQLPHQLGGIVPTADMIVRGATIRGGGMKQAGHDGTAAIRAGAAINLTVDHCWLNANQNGIGPSGFPGTLTVTNTFEEDNFLRNDPTPGGSHNVYAEGVAATFGPGFTSIVNATTTGEGGHAVKSRAKVTTLIAPFYLYSGDSSSLDIPDGSTAICNIGSGTIGKKAGDANHTVLGYGVESQLNGLAGVKLSGTTIDALCDNPLIGAAGAVNFDAQCKFTGNKPTGPQGGLVTGLPA